MDRSHLGSIPPGREPRQRDFDPFDQLERYWRWWRQGYLSSTGHCLDIGITTAKALARYEDARRSGALTTFEFGSTDPYTADNGSIMRLAPVPVAFAARPLDAIRFSGQSSLTTHRATEAVDACRYLGALIVGALRGASNEELLGERYSPVPGYCDAHLLASAIDEIAHGSFKTREPPEIQGTGYVVKSLEAAPWAFHRTSDFRSGCLAAVNPGDNADTTGAVYGQLAGAFYGASGIPVE